MSDIVTKTVWLIYEGPRGNPQHLRGVSGSNRSSGVYGGPTITCCATPYYETLSDFFQQRNENMKAARAAALAKLTPEEQAILGLV